MPETVLISEVGPRDGLQSIPARLAAPHKQAWIEVGFFVPARLLPHWVDTAQVVGHARTTPSGEALRGLDTAGAPA